MRRETRSDSLIYFLIKDMNTGYEALAIGTCLPNAEIELDIGHVVRPITKSEHDSYIALDLFPPYKSKKPRYVWVARYGPDGVYYGITMWGDEKRKFPV